VALERFKRARLKLSSRHSRTLVLPKWSLGVPLGVVEGFPETLSKLLKSPLESLRGPLSPLEARVTGMGAQTY